MYIFLQQKCHVCDESNEKGFRAALCSTKEQNTEQLASIDLM